MTCNDCIHFDACRNLLEAFNPEYKGKSLTFTKACKHFKNKADFVEVVRCKDCKHCELRYPAKAIGEEAIEGYYCYPNQRYVKSTEFCSYGERRDT